MNSKKIIRVRISMQLADKIMKEAQKKEKRKSAYVREQLDGQTAFKDENLDTVYQKLNYEVHSIGLKINYKARLFNTYGAVDIDPEINLLLKKTADELTGIIRLLKDTSIPEGEKEIMFDNPEKKTVNLNLAVSGEMLSELKLKAGKLKIGVSRLVRNRMENPLRYTKTDIVILQKQIHYKIYPIISNVEQICFRYAESNIKNIYTEINKLNDDVAKIAELENKIMFCLKE